MHENSTGWPAIAGREATVTISSLALELPLSDIYGGV
jgi:hypothetical protein